MSTTELTGSPPSSASSEEVEPLDYLFFRTEGDPRARSTGMAIEILDRVPDWDRLVEAFDRASRLVVRLRQKVVVPLLTFSAPRWVVDPDFDLDYHLRRVAVPAPGTLRRVLDLASMVEAPLDTARPLWEATLVEGLEGGRAALFTKMSHALTDGVGAMQLRKLMYDAERDPTPEAMPPLPVPAEVTPEQLTRDALRRLPRSSLSTASRFSLDALRISGRTVQAPASSVQHALHYVQSVRRLLETPIEPSPLLARRSLTSRVEVHELPLDDLRRAGQAAGGSVNDAYLAAMGGVMLRYHEALGVAVDTLPIAIPISLRSSADAAGGNHWGAGRLGLPVGEKDPIARMRDIHEQVLAARAEPAIAAMNVAAVLLSRVPASLLGLVHRGLENIDLQLSNIPGDPEPTYIAGARIDANYVVGPLPGVAMMVTMMTIAGRACIGARYDKAAVTDYDLFARCLREGFDEIAAVGSEPRGRRRQHRGHAGGVTRWCMSDPSDWVTRVVGERRAARPVSK